jgi:hypothetical protein
MKRSLKAFGLVELDEGSWFVTLNTYVEGSSSLRLGVSRKWTLSAAPMTGHDKFKVESTIISPPRWRQTKAP